MPKYFITLLAAFCLIVGGCDHVKKFMKMEDKEQPTTQPETELPLSVRGTISEYATLIDGGYLPVRGFGLVVGLGKNGSSEVPPSLEKYLVQYLARHKIGSASAGLENITPQRVIRDNDTAVVEVRGIIPPGLPKGQNFDVFVQALPQTQTSSLEGGMLMPTELRLATSFQTSPESGSKVWAMASGSVFVNPFIDASKPTQATKLRMGRVLGGGKSKRARELRLMLRSPDYARCSLIQRRINGRYGSGARIANAINPSLVQLEVPRQFRKNFRHYMNLVTHLPLSKSPGDWEVKARQIAGAMKQSGAEHEELALILEAMGRQILPQISHLYTNSNQAAAFYTARTGLRLGDDAAGEVIMDMAGKDDSPYQLQAIQELGKRRDYTRASGLLRRLLNSKNDMVRLAAYEAILSRGESGSITEHEIGGAFRLHAVDSKRDYVIYATQSRKPKIVLFGGRIPIRKPLFFNSHDDLVTINAMESDDKFMIFRKIPRTGGLSEDFRVEFNVASLVKTMGNLAEPDNEGNVKGLGLTYSQIVGVLYRMCEAGDIPAKFVLQPPPGLRERYQSALTGSEPQDSIEE